MVFLGYIRELQFNISNAYFKINKENNYYCHINSSL